MADDGVQEQADGHAGAVGEEDVLCACCVVVSVCIRVCVRRTITGAVGEEDVLCTRGRG